MSQHIAILCGGTSSERDVSIASAQNVFEQLKDKNAVKLYVLPEDWDDFVLKKDGVACVIPIFHGEGGEDGEVQQQLDQLGIPYIFSEPAAHKLGLDKEATKQLAASIGITTPTSYSTANNQLVFSRPVIIKPNNGGSSIGTTIARNQNELDTELATAQKEGDVIVEDYISGREFTVAIIDRGNETQALPVVEIKPKDREFFDFESKYDAELVDEICPAEIDNVLAEQLQEAALKIHNAIGAKHLTRSDFIVDDTNKIWFLEINTIPGTTLNSLVPKTLHAADINFATLLLEWINETI